MRTIFIAVAARHPRPTDTSEISAIQAVPLNLLSKSRLLPRYRPHHKEVRLRSSRYV